jgi:hypothetical protein
MSRRTAVVMSALCQKRTYAVQQIPAYSITVSAIASTLDKIEKPRAFAVFKVVASPTCQQALHP